METESKAESALPKNSITTKLKFIKSERNDTLISFISQNPVNGVVCGVRANSPYPKKIVIIDRMLANDILPNVLYDCVLVPMSAISDDKHGKDFIPGYIAIRAVPVQFKAVVTTKYIRGAEYSVEASFGNKIIRFDPFRGRKETMKSLPACTAVLEKRYDVQNLLEVVDNFVKAGNDILTLMKSDMREIHSRKKRV